MKRLLSLVVLAGCASTPEEAPVTRPVHTYSIVARDARTGELGVAVQSHWFNVGPIVAWAEAGVGAVATQSFANPSFGPEGLALMRAGRAPEEALAKMIGADGAPAVRQVALVDAKGRAAVHTGERCIAWAGHRLGDGYSAQANMMLGDGVVDAMAEAFESSEGPLAERLVAAIEAAQGAGGDIRGQQAAALLVVKGESTGDPAKDLVVDLRVEDHERPVEELRRLYTIHRAYQHMNAGDAAMEEGEMDRALAEYAAASKLVPDNVEVVFWNAFTMAVGDRLDDSLPLFRSVFDSDEHWIELLKRLPASGLTDEATVARILEGAGR